MLYMFTLSQNDLGATSIKVTTILLYSFSVFASMFPFNTDFLLFFGSGITGLVDTKDLGMKILEDYAKSWPWILM